MKGWPVELRDGPLLLRPLHRRDGRAWNRTRAENAEWLRPWEATPPEGFVQPTSFRRMLRMMQGQARRGQLMSFAVLLQGRLVGQVTVAGIVWGSLRSGHVGYWIDRRVAGQGIAPRAVAMVIDHCLETVGLHRLEVVIRPENAASLRVVAKLGLREEGMRLRYLHIDGAWRDHRTFAVLAGEFPGGLHARLARHTVTPADG